MPWNATRDTEERKIRSIIGSVNVKLKQIAVKLGITSDISTYFARHTFATMMHNLGADGFLIRDVIGHEDIKSTQSYMGSQSKGKLIELQDMLLK